VHLYPFDAEYLQRLRDGDPATEEHFAGYFTPLLLIKLHNSGVSRSVIADVTQETYLRVLRTVRSPKGIKSAGSFGAFVIAVSMNVLQEQRREQKRIEPLDDDYPDRPSGEPDALEALLTAERAAAVQKTLDEMDERDAKILRAGLADDRRTRDICAEFGVKPDYLRVLLHRARKNFRNRFQGGE
jgi:RNA polymerase sigma-70 factor (ECF subfamily)